MKIERKCNVYDCNGTMRPTRETYLPPWMESSDEETKEDFLLRVYVCVTCGNKANWKDKPDLTHNSAARLHKFLYREGWLSQSMISDPKFYPPKEPKNDIKKSSNSELSKSSQHRIEIRIGGELYHRPIR